MLHQEERMVGEDDKEQRETLGLTLELLYGDLEEILPYRETLRLSLFLSLSGASYLDGDLEILHPWIKRFADGVHDEADLAKRFHVQYVAPVEDESGFLHVVVDALVVQLLELVPFRDDANCVCIFRRLVRVPHHAHLLEGSRALWLQMLRVIPVEFVHCEIPLHLILCNLRVVDAQKSFVAQKAVADVDCWGFPCIACVLLECEPQNGDLLAGDSVEHGGNHALHESRLLVVVDLHYLFPVVCDLGKAIAFANVHQVQDVLLEARSAETDAGVQELRSDSRVLADGVRDFRDVGASRLAESGHGIDGRDSLRQECIRCELRKLGGPQVGSQDAILRHPVRVHGLQSLHGLSTAGSLATSDEHTIGLGQIFNGGSLCKKLGIGKDLEIDTFVVVVRKDLLDCFGSLHRHSGFLHHDLIRLGDVRNHTSRTLPVSQIRGFPSSKTTGLGGRIHRNEDDIGLGNVLLHIGTEEEILVPTRLHDFIESGLVDGKIGTIPGSDPWLGNVDHHHLDIRTLQSDHRHCRTPDIASSNAANLHHLAWEICFSPKGKTKNSRRCWGCKSEQS